MSKLVYIFVFAISIFGCNNQDNGKSEPEVVEQERNKEAREDSLKMAEALATQSKFTNKVYAIFETEPTISEDGEDAADDPCIYISPTDSSKSLIIGTNKKAGLEVYDMMGRRLQHIKCGLVNNVDLRYGFEYNGKKGALVGATNRSKNSISFFFIDYEKNLVSDEIYSIACGVDEVYGFTMHRNVINGRFYAIVNGKNGMVEQYEVSMVNGKMINSKVNTFKVNSQPEGMVADDETATLYIGVEEEAIFKASLKPGNDAKLKMLNQSDKSNPNIQHDIEGLTIFRFGGKKYLIASSQGNFSYAVFEIGKTERYVTNFVISENSIDGVEETDGLDVSTFTYSGKYPNGIFVVQDGFNFDEKSSKTQNFKIIPMDSVVKFIK